MVAGVAVGAAAIGLPVTNTVIWSLFVQPAASFTVKVKVRVALRFMVCGARVVAPVEI
ncbi:MAG: DUF2568 domain-containing protein [Bacteroidetes bacterium]|nr:DUF2568 domain-containing protein [Bacteroidota bacterium]